MELEYATPNPEYLIKSISEQGYSLESALADLIDNCISADASNIEILVDPGNEPYTLFLADDGCGMTEAILRAAMQFPSDSPDSERGKKDLGRFGLGMKTASFSQTRKFIVITRPKGEKSFKAMTWDVELLKQGKWCIGVNDGHEIQKMLSEYYCLSSAYYNKIVEFTPNTIVVWQGLYKFENYIDADHRSKALKREITEITSEHLSLVFHRFLEKKKNPLNIRVNNYQLIPFNPFPTEEEKDLRPIESKERAFASDSISIEGFVLPSRAIEESHQGGSRWTTKHKSLLDMEGVYIYRAGRIISFGGWNGLIKKAPKLQLARLRVEIGNKVDHLLHLNVAKSQVVIPHDLKPGFESYVKDLKDEAVREFLNRGISKLITNKTEKAKLFEKRASSKGLIFSVNNDFPLYSSLCNGLTSDQLAKLKILMKLVATQLNMIRRTHEPEPFIEVNENQKGLKPSDITMAVQTLLDGGIDKKIIRTRILPDLGYVIDTLPEETLNLLG